MKRITLPIKDSDIENLKAGESVLLSGKIITGRDAAHKRFYDLINSGEKLPICHRWLACRPIRGDGDDRKKSVKFALPFSGIRTRSSIVRLSAA